jgi:putative ABC transport system permease protein
MLAHYLTTALRSLRKNRVATLINATGLGLGIAAFGFIWQYVAFERSVDQFHTNLPNLYRVLLQAPDQRTWEFGPGGLSADAKAAFPDIADACRLITGPASAVVTIEQTQNGKTDVVPFREEQSAFVDGSFFRLFSLPLRSGNAASLGQPNVVFLAESTARRYFGDAPAVGKTITANSQFGKTLYTVGGVYADVPENSDLRFTLLYSLQTLASEANRKDNSWADPTAYNANFLQAALLLKPTTNVPALEKKLTDFYHAKKPDEANLRVRLQPMANLHLGQSVGDAFVTTGSLGFVYLLAGLGLLIVLIAWLNYVNLSTATALTRAKEVGVRKVVGATQAQLVGQLLGESLLINALGLGVGLLLMALLQPVFNQFVNKQLSLATLLLGRAGEPGLWLWAVGTLLLGTLISGGYVAWVLTRIQPAGMVRGQLSSSGGKSYGRQGLVVVQFGIAVVLMLVTMVLYQQVRYLQNRPLGLSLDGLLTVVAPEVGKDQPDFKTRRATFQQQVAGLSFVETMSNSGSVPGNWYNFNTSSITRQTPRPGDDKITYNVVFADEHYLPLFGIKLVAGQNFTHTQTESKYDFTGGENVAVLLNERAARDLGFGTAQAAIGQRLIWDANKYEVIGVVSNYRHQSPKIPVEAIIMFPRQYGSNLTLRLAPGNTAQQIGQLERLYKAAYPGNPFQYFTVPERYNEQYAQEQQYSQLFSTAAGLAIFIACLGLFGLATFTAQRRTKEIGVRKTMGASEFSIVALLSKDFLKLVGIAFLIAAPVGYWLMTRWLADFAEKTPLHWWLFAGSGTLAALIALLTISFQTLRAARANPVASLRSE